MPVTVTTLKFASLFSFRPVTYVSFFPQPCEYDSSLTCLKIPCYLERMKRGDQVQIQVTSRVWESTLVKVLVIKINDSPHDPRDRESQTVLDSGFQAVSYGFQVLRILCQWNLDSGFLKQKFLESGVPDTLQKLELLS